MNAEQYFERAKLLIAQHRHRDAIDSLRQTLAIEPNNGLAHAWLGYCLAQDRDRLSEAMREVQLGVHLDPQNAIVHHVMAAILIFQERNDEALQAIDESIRLNPSFAESYLLRSIILGEKDDWTGALLAAEAGLQFEPENESLLAHRVIALERLGRVEDAVEQAGDAVARSPDSGDAHASRGWALLQKGNVREAQEAFREALRLEPMNQLAREGMIQAINSRNPIYRFFYAIMIKLSRLDARTQWFLFIGAWLVAQGMIEVSHRWPAFEPWVLPLIAVYLLFVMMSWIMAPLFNALLRFHPFGKYLLSDKEKMASNLIVGALASGVLLGVIAAVIHREPVLAVLPALGALYLCIPIVVIFRVSAKWAWVVALLVAIGFISWFLFNALLAVSGYVSVPSLQGFGIGIVVYSFVSQWLIMARPKH